MITTCKLRLYTLLAILALLFAASGNAWGEPVSIRYAGTGFDTAFNNGDDDAYPVDLSLADAKGSFGASKMEVVAEFMEPLQDNPLQDNDCNEDYALLGVSYVASVITFEKLDQLLGFSWQGGWMCVNWGTGHHYGHIEGMFTGGTGRFQGASGTWMTNFEGFHLEPPFIESRAGFRTFSGDMSGDVNLPSKGE